MCACVRACMHACLRDALTGELKRIHVHTRSGEAVVQRLAIEAKAKAFAPNEDEIDDLLSLSDSE